MKTFTQPETMEQPVLLEVFTNKNKDARMLKNYYHQLKQNKLCQHKESGQPSENTTIFF